MSQRYYHSSQIFLGKLFLIGGYLPAMKSTEFYDPNVGKWQPGFSLQGHGIYHACSVKVSPHELITIAGQLSPTREMYKYDLVSGAARKINAVPKTLVYSKS